MNVLAKLDLQTCVLWLSVFAGKHILQRKKTKQKTNYSLFHSLEKINE